MLLSFIPLLRFGEAKEAIEQMFGLGADLSGADTFACATLESVEDSPVFTHRSGVGDKDTFRCSFDTVHALLLHLVGEPVTEDDPR